MLRFMDIPAYRNVDKGPKDTAENKRRILAVDDETDIRIHYCPVVGLQNIGK